MTRAEVLTPIPPRRRHAAIAWPLGFALSVPVIFIFYKYVLPKSASSLQRGFNDWLPLSVINISLIWVIMALGLNIVVGYAGLLDLGFVAFWAIGTYTGAWLMSSFVYGQWGKITIHLFSPYGVRHQHGIHITFWLVLIIAGAFCALWGVVIGAPTLRLRSDYLALVTLGFGEIIPQVFTNGDSLFGRNITNGTRGINPVDPIGTGPLSRISNIPAILGPFDLSYKFLVFALLAAVCVFISLRIRRGRLGRAWLAIREDELAASMMGVPVVKAKLSAYAVGAVFGGLGGAAYSSLVGGAFPNFTFANSITILLMVVLGGMGNVWGVMLGAIALSWINERGLSQFSSWYNGQFHSQVDFPSYNFLIFGIILVLMMLFRREGLLPESRTRQILREPSRAEMEAIGADIEAAEAEIEVTEISVAEEPEPVAAAKGGKS
jgi:branched-chain amino acid transport system permease protein